MRKYLIAGLGPALMETEDLGGSYYDPHNQAIREQYILQGQFCGPEQFVYQDHGREYPLLRAKMRQSHSDYISEVLKSVLDDRRVDHTLIPISKIWNSESFSCNKEPCIVCLSTTFMWNETMIDRAIQWVFENLNCSVLILGGQYSVLKCDYIQSKHSKRVNYIITGEAELSLVPLLDWLDAEKDTFPKHIPNLWYRDAAFHFHFTHKSEFDYRESKTVVFNGQSSYVPYMSMRGCPYGCKFCALRECTPKWQYLTAERIISDWDTYHKNNGAQHFSINDSTFFIPFRKIEKLLHLLSERDYTWDANARADTPFTEVTVKQLEDAGCTALFFGFESMCDSTLNKMDKRTSAALNRRINRLFMNSSIITKMSFIVGFPGETPDDYQKTHDYLVNEHYGRYSLYVFEYEGDILPISKESEKYQIRVLEEKQRYSWAHAGEHWAHIGMDSDTARKLRRDTIKETRTNPASHAVFRTWQDAFEWPFVPHLSKEENLKIEKLLDRLVFLPVDTRNPFETEMKIIIQALQQYGIYLKRGSYESANH